jgi:hypothetical protein
MKWVFVVVRQNKVSRIKIFDDYFVGEQYANEYLKLVFGIEKDFPEYRKGQNFTSKDNIIIGLYKDGTWA